MTNSNATNDSKKNIENIELSSNAISSLISMNKENAESTMRYINALVRASGPTHQLAASIRDNIGLWERIIEPYKNISGVMEAWNNITKTLNQPAQNLAQSKSPPPLSESEIDQLAKELATKSGSKTLERPSNQQRNFEELRRQQELFAPKKSTTPSNIAALRKQKAQNTAAMAQAELEGQKLLAKRAKKTAAAIEQKAIESAPTKTEQMKMDAKRAERALNATNRPKPAATTKTIKNVTTTSSEVDEPKIPQRRMELDDVARELGKLISQKAPSHQHQPPYTHPIPQAQTVQQTGPLTSPPRKKTLLQKIRNVFRGKDKSTSGQER